MSSLKRTERAKTKARSRGGRHARPADQSAADVPAELRSTDYGFPTVHLPEGHAHVTSAELIAALDDEQLLPWEQELLNASAEPSPVNEDRRAAYVERLTRSRAAIADDEPGVDETPTQALPVVGKVVDQAQKPAHAEGLAPVPAPAIPDPVTVTSTGPRHAVPTVGSALPARLTEWESAVLGGLTHEQAAQAAVDQDAAWQARIDEMAAYWAQVDERFRRGPEHYVREKTRFDLDQIERWSAYLGQQSRRPYQYGPQQPVAALPHRRPGAFRAAIEASRGELVAQ